jgi:hypothetical protein
MPFELVPQEICNRCPYGVCVTYIGDQKFKDRATHYRIAQNTGMSCAFDSWIPGFTAIENSNTSWDYFTDRVAINAEKAGIYLEDMGAFQSFKHRFSLTSGQKAKVAGDVFELLSRAILWNCCVEINTTTQESQNGSKLIAAITLGDNYDLNKLFMEDESQKLSAYEERLRQQDTRLCYSTPDLIVVDITNLPPEKREQFGRKIDNLNPDNQRLLSNSCTLLEGHVRPADLLFAAGVKTSIRSDRMYQLLFEANAWKFIWREIFEAKPSRYYTIIGSQPYGVNIEKLRSVDFTSAQNDSIAVPHRV